MSQGEFTTLEAWEAFTGLIASQLTGVDVKEISVKDFSEDGELVMSPPSVRSFFAEETAQSTSDTQRLSYNAVVRMIALCGDEDLRSPQAQAKASLRLAGQVKSLMIGARLVLASGDRSEPVTYIGTIPEPVEGLGIAYAAAFEVPGLAQFAGPNANPAGGDD